MKFFSSILLVLTLTTFVWAFPPSPLTIRLQTVTSGLASPVLVRNAKDGTKRLFIVQQRGLIRVLQPGATTSTTFMDITSKVSSSGSERGLLGLTFHPNFATKQLLFCKLHKTF